MKKVLFFSLSLILTISMISCSLSLEEKLENITIDELNEKNSMASEIEIYGGLYISCVGSTTEGALTNESCLYIADNGNLVYAFDSTGVNESHMLIKDGVYYYFDKASNELSTAVFPIKKHNINTLYYLDYTSYAKDCLKEKYIDENENFVFTFEYADSDSKITEKSRITIDPSSLSALKEELETYDEDGKLISRYTLLLSHGEKKNIDTSFVNELKEDNSAFTVTVIDKDKNGSVISTRGVKVYASSYLFLQDVSQGYVAYTDEACTQKASTTIKVESDCTYYFMEK